MSEDFYIGYLPTVPPMLRSFVRKTVAALLILAAGLALALVYAQHRFAASTFEYGAPRDFQGVIRSSPYPSLEVARPNSQHFSRYLLVGTGKHGAAPMIAGFANATVKLRGTLIYRDGTTAIEIAPGSIEAVSNDTRSNPSVLEDLREVRLAGEIVDSKCYLGVMNPGSGKVHRDCAARCASGGIPPSFVEAGSNEVYELTDRSGRAIDPAQIRDFIGEPIRVNGTLERVGDTKRLLIDPSALTHR